MGAWIGDAGVFFQYIFGLCYNVLFCALVAAEQEVTRGVLCVVLAVRVCVALVGSARGFLRVSLQFVVRTERTRTSGGLQAPADASQEETPMRVCFGQACQRARPQPIVLVVLPHHSINSSVV